MAQATNAHTATPSGEKNFPPFQPENYPSQLLWLVVAFAALYLLMSRIALPRIGAIFEDRRRRIDGDVTEAKRLKDESDTALAAYEKSLADARNRAQGLANETREKQAGDAEAARKALDAKLNARIAEAEKSIEERKSAALSNVKGIATDAAAAIVQRLIGLAPASREIEAAVAEVLKR
jgi:F-type H+-transporting ATPase subunit b